MGGLAGSALFVSADFGEGAGGVEILASGTLASGVLSAALGDSLGGSAALEGGDFVSGALGSAALGSTALGGSIGFEDGAFSRFFRHRFIGPCRKTCKGQTVEKTDRDAVFRRGDYLHRHTPCVINWWGARGVETEATSCGRQRVHNGFLNRLATPAELSRQECRHQQNESDADQAYGSAECIGCPSKGHHA